MTMKRKFRSIVLVGSVMAASASALPASAQTNASAKARSPARTPVCTISDFRTVGLSIHNPDARHRAGMDWLRIHLPHCSLEQVRALSANRSSWFGTADDVHLAGMIDRAIELLASDRPDLLRSLYSGPAAEGAAATQGSVQSITARSARSAGVDPAQAYQQQQYQQQYQQPYQQQQYQQPYPQQAPAPQPAGPTQ